jgi:hypothetical protein
VDFSGLAPAQRKAALKRLNTDSCNCGSTLTLAQCRINDTACLISKGLAEKVVKEILSAPAPLDSAGTPSSNADPAAPSSPAAN